MSTLTYTLVACLVAGVLSLSLAGTLAFRLPARIVGRLIAFAAGAMLAAALLDILPEAIELAAGATEGVLATLLASLVAFYLLERAAIWRHSHAGDGDHGHAPNEAAAWAVVIGDGVHNLVDGVLIAAAFLADPWLGVTATLAVVAHEVPQELGDFVLLLSAGWSRRKALLANGASSAAAILGGLLGWVALDGARDALPYALAVAAGSFLYIAVADLMPLLHRRRSVDGFLPQSALLVAGLVCIPLAGHWLH
jgi:zinc and cadmium transporter